MKTKRKGGKDHTDVRARYAQGYTAVAGAGRKMRTDPNRASAMNSIPTNEAASGPTCGLSFVPRVWRIAPTLVAKISKAAHGESLMLAK